MRASAIFGLAGLALLVAGCDSLTQTGVNDETPTDPVERGRYLVSFAGCHDCHTPGYLLGMPDMSRMLGGSEVGFEIPGLGVFHGPNLTPDMETGLGSWSEEQIVAAFTTGKRPDGRELAPAMPWRGFANLTPADAMAIAIYLKSLPPVVNKVPGPFGPTDTPTAFVMRVIPPSGAEASPVPPAP
jgi:mono/diheme cytochrome c family protein